MRELDFKSSAVAFLVGGLLLFLLATRVRTSSRKWLFILGGLVGIAVQASERLTGAS